MRWGEMYNQKPVLMSLAEANALLGGPHSTEEAVQAAYRTAVRASHPDTRVDPGTGVPLSQLKTAREVLLAGLNQGQEITCKLCGGSGRVGVGFGAPCAACKGEGIVHG